LLFKKFLIFEHVPSITDFCSCVYVFGCKLSLVRLCDSDFGIIPLYDITIGIKCADFCLLLLLLLLILLLTTIDLSPGGSGYFTCIQNMKLVKNKFMSGGLYEKHVVATWNLAKHLSICFWTQGNQEKLVSRWPVAGPSEY
jgi:hypothetical protein